MERVTTYLWCGVNFRHLFMEEGHGGIKKAKADVKIMEGCLLSIQKARETMPESSVKHFPQQCNELTRRQLW